MSETALPRCSQDYAPPDVIKQMAYARVIIGLPFAAISVVCIFKNKGYILQSWLVAFMFWLGLT